MKNAPRHLLLVLIAAALLPSAFADCTPPATGDWLVTNATTCTDTEIVMNGSIVVDSNLTLDNVTLTLLAYSDPFFILTRGNLTIQNSTLIGENSIRAHNGSTLILRNSIVPYTVYIEDSSADIEGNTISTPGKKPVHTINTVGLRVRHNSLSGDNTVLDRATEAFIENNAATTGMLFIESTYNIVSGNLIETHEENASGMHFSVFSTNNRVTGNTITTYGTASPAISLAGTSSNILTDNTLRTLGNDSHGLLAAPGLTTNTNNTFTGNDIIAFGSGSYAVLLEDAPDTTFHENTLTSEKNLSFSNLQSHDVNATRNYWWTVNQTNITEEIHDFFDNASLGTVDFCPFLDAAGASIPCANQTNDTSQTQDDPSTTCTVNETILFPDNEGFEIGTGSDQLELREPLGEVTDTVTEYELPGLKSGSINTSAGNTEYYQYLRFKDGSNLQNSTANYATNADGSMDAYLVMLHSMPFIEWEIQFPNGAASERDTETGDLDDLGDKTFNIMGQDFTIVKANVNAGGGEFAMTLMNGIVADTLREGETRQYVINGSAHNITLAFVSDPNTGTASVKFIVNGELTDLLEKGDTATVGGITLGVRDILVNSREGVASFFLGTKTLVFRDPNTNNSDAFDGTAELNNVLLPEILLDVQGRDLGLDSYEITDIKYLALLNTTSNGAAYISEHHTLRELMRDPSILISDTLDIRFEGLDAETAAPLDIIARGSDEYTLEFTNIQSKEYLLPLLSNRGAVWKYGDSDDDLIFVEGTSGTDYVIGDGDYFIVSNDRGASDADKSVTNVLRYEDYDNVDFTLELTDVTSGNAVNVPIAADGIGSLAIGGHTYTVNVSDRSADTPTLAVDLNADGDIANDVVQVTVLGGVVVDLAETVQYLAGGPTLSTGSTDGTALSAIVRDGATLSGGNTSAPLTVTMTARVLAKNFDTSHLGDEVIRWTVRRNDTGIDARFSDYAGPLHGRVPGEQGAFQFAQPNSTMSDWRYGMSDWGILIKEHTPNGTAGEFSLDVPERQQFAQVFIVLGETGDVNVSCAAIPACGDGNIDEGETCSSCPTDAGACPTIQTSSGGGGGGGGGGGYFPPPQEEPQDEPEPEHLETETVGTGPETTQDDSQGEEQIQPQEQNDNLVTGAVTGGGFGSWPFVGSIVGLIGGLFLGVYLSRR